VQERQRGREEKVWIGKAWIGLVVVLTSGSMYKVVVKKERRVKEG
jgi:hypothetical protein